MRDSQTKKIPYTLILGDKEQENGEISYRLFGSKETTTVKLEDFISKIKQVIEDKE